MPVLPASILTVSAAERSLAFWSRVATCHGIKPLSHPAVRQPRSSDRWTWSLVEQTGEPRSFSSALPEQRTHHAPKGRSGWATGLSFEHHQTVRLQTSRRPHWPYRLRATTRWRPAEARLHAPQEDDPLRRRQRTSALRPHLPSRNPWLP